jgi:hypothetical protein
MNMPTSTGEAARLLGVSEPQLNDLVRRRKIEPAPPIVSGRRLWQRSHLAQAAEALGLGLPPTSALQAREVQL